MTFNAEDAIKQVSQMVISNDNEYAIGWKQDKEFSGGGDKCARAFKMKCFKMQCHRFFL